MEFLKTHTHSILVGVFVWAYGLLCQPHTVSKHFIKRNTVLLYGQAQGNSQPHGRLKCGAIEEMSFNSNKYAVVGPLFHL